MLRDRIEKDREASVRTDHLSIRENQYDVVVYHAQQSVSDRDQSTVSHLCSKSPLDERVRLVIEGSGSFVKDVDLCTI